MKSKNKENMLKDIKCLGATEEFLNLSDDSIRFSIVFALYIVNCMGFKDRVILAIEIILGKRFLMSFADKGVNKNETKKRQTH